MKNADLALLIILLTILPVKNIASEVRVETHPFGQFLEIESDVVVLDIFNVPGSPAVKFQRYVPSDTTLNQIARDLDILSGKTKNELRLPFGTVRFVPQLEEKIFSERVPAGVSFRKYQGGVSLGENATFYFRAGVLWEPISTKKVKFYFPYRKRSFLGIGVVINW